MDASNSTSHMSRSCPSSSSSSARLGASTAQVSTRALAQPDPDLVEQVLVGEVSVDVLLAEAQCLQPVQRPVVVHPLREGGAVVERDPQLRVGEVDLQPAFVQPSSSMTVWSSRPMTYAHGLTTYRWSGNGRSSVAAPPSRLRASSTSTD